MKNRNKLNLNFLFAIVVLLFFTQSSECDQRMRGPHHPRGSAASHSHVHYVPSKENPPVKLTQDKKLLHDTEHIQEDFGYLDKDTVMKMSDEELEFRFFKAHDFDNNTKLDGLEILQAIKHAIPEYHNEDKLEPTTEQGEADSIRKRLKERREMLEDIEYFSELIDKVLEEDDLDHDGYLSYSEFHVGRSRHIS